MFPGLIAGAVLLAAAPPEPNAPPEARKDALARYGAGIWQARRDRLLSAAKAFEAAAKQDPDATAPLKELVRIYSQLGREPEAIRTARAILEKDPRDADTAHTLARLLFDAGELKDAIAAAKVAAANVDAVERPDKALAIDRDLATLCEKAGDFPAAADAVRKGVDLLTMNRKAVLASGAFTPKEIDAEAADCWERLGRVLVKAGKYEDAATAFQVAAKLFADPDRVNNPAAAARLDWNLAGALAGQGDPAAALTHLQAFLKLRPQATEPYEELARVLRQAGRDAAVVPALRRHVELDPKNWPLLAVLAGELARDPATRRQANELFEQLDPATNDPKVVRAVVRSHVETDQARQVIIDLDQAYSLLKKDDAKDAEKRAFAAEKARTIGEVLRAEPPWTAAVLRAAAEDLRRGNKRTHQTYYVLGSLAARHGKLTHAAELLQATTRNAPKETEASAYAALIDVLWRNRRPAEVAQVCRDGLRAAEHTSPVLFNFHLALALAELGDGAEALTAVEKAILQAADTDRLLMRLRKLAVLRVLGKWDDAIKLGRALFDEFDGPADRLRVRYALAGVYWGAKKYAEAEAELRAILDADPDHAAACNDLGYHLADQGRNLDEAARLVRRAVEVDRIERRRAGDPEPDNAAYLDSLGWVLFRQGKLPAARELLERSSLLPDGAADAVVWDHLGDVYFRLGEKAKAKAAWEQANGLYQTDSRGKRDGRLDELKRKLTRVP